MSAANSPIAAAIDNDRANNEVATTGTMKTKTIEAAINSAMSVTHGLSQMTRIKIAMDSNRNGTTNTYAAGRATSLGLSSVM